MNLVLALEEEFRIRFTDEEIVQLGDAGTILQALQNKGVGA
jgi:acyl carrier protein